MASLPTLTFITSNKNKLAEVQAILGNDIPFNLQNQNVDIVEIQGTIEEVALDKCKRASEAVSFAVPFINLALASMKALGMSHCLIAHLLSSTGPMPCTLHTVLMRHLELTLERLLFSFYESVKYVHRDNYESTVTDK